MRGRDGQLIISTSNHTLLPVYPTLPSSTSPSINSLILPVSSLPINPVPIVTGAVLPRLRLPPLPSSISDFLDDDKDSVARPAPSSPSSSSSPASSTPQDDNLEYFVRCGRCSAAYSVPADLVKPEGGRVKCEVCGHTWFQASNRLQVLSQGYVLKVRSKRGREGRKGGRRVGETEITGAKLSSMTCIGLLTHRSSPPFLSSSIFPSLPLFPKDYPDDLREKVAENVRNNRHPLDTSASKGAISVFVGNLPFSVRVIG